MSTRQTTLPVPSHWKQGPLRHFTTFVTGWTPPTSDESGYGGEHPWATIADLTSPVVTETSKTLSDEAVVGLTPCNVGDVLFSFKLSVGTVSRAGVPMYTNEAIATFGPTELLEADYAFYALPVFVPRNANTNIYGAALLNGSLIRSAWFAAPSIEVQRAIADYLDRETAQIDTLIAEQQRLIELLHERRQSAVDNLTWHGTDDSVRRKEAWPDAVEPIPEHWTAIRNKQAFSERTALSESGDEELLTVSHITGVTPRSQKTVTMTAAESHVGYRIVEIDDLVINTMWAWMGALGVSPCHGIASPAYGVYEMKADSPLIPGYVHYVTRSRPYVTEMTRYSRGIWSSRLRLYPESFLRLLMPVPPLDEQRRIVAELDEVAAKIDTLIGEAERFIELAKERRSALITAAVTGQIDIPGVE